MKYIVFLSPEGPRVAVFAAPTTHADEATAHPEWTVRSAGYLQFLGQASVRCYGRSDSLNRAVSPHDERLIEAMLRATARMCPPPPSIPVPA